MLRRLIPYLKPLWFRLMVAVLGMAAVAGISTGVMWLMKYLIDNALTQKDLSALQSGVVLIVVGFALKSILWYSHTYLASYVAQSVSRQLRDDVYSHLYSLSMGFFNEKTSSGLMARLTNDVTVLQQALMSTPTVVIRDGLTVLGLVGFIFYTNWRFALICFSILPIAAYLTTHLGIKSRRAGREGQAKMSELYHIIQESVLAMPIVKTFQNESKEIDEFKKENKDYFDVMMRLARVDARSSPIMEVLGSFVLAIMLAIGGRHVINGSWSLGGFVAFIGAAMSLYNPIKQFAKLNVQTQQGLAAGERVFQLLDQKATVYDKPDASEATPLSQQIEFKEVSFSYPTSPNVLHQINLSLKKGEILALVGPSGSGKTTIAQLLLRFYDPTEGALLMDGKDYRDLSTRSLRHQMAVVTQETHLFNDTVWSNIEYGKPGSSHEEILLAAQAAYAHDFISKLPNGYDTFIGERGTRISGGERQRIAIARALLKNPAILILDEATSALDAASEQMVQKALDRLLQGRTVLMIAHRLSTVRKAHRIVVLENGRIKESGSHEELLQKKGAYHQLYDMQMLPI